MNPPAARAPSFSKLFYTPLIEMEFGANAPVLDQMAQVIQTRRQDDPGIKRSNAGGWHSDTHMRRWGGRLMEGLAVKTLEVATHHTNDLGKTADQYRFQFGLEMWANVSPPGASNHVHAHPNAFWSAVFFVADGGAKNEGHLVLIDPRFPLTQMYNSDLVVLDDQQGFQNANHRIAPKPGKLVLFPSWLMHYVEPHDGEGDRISIAMNITVTPNRPQGAVR